MFVLIRSEFIYIDFLFCFQSDLDIESSKGLNSDEMKTFWKSVDLAKLQLPAGIDVNNVEVKVEKVVVDVNRFHYLIKYLLTKKTFDSYSEYCMIYTCMDRVQFERLLLKPSYSD